MPFRNNTPPPPSGASVRHRPIVAGRYRLKRALGSGGSGRVHLADDLETRTQVAVKLLNATLVDHGASQSRFLDEARILAAIEHRNVVQVLDVGFDAELRPYFVMEYVEAPTLRDVLRREGLLSLRRATRLMTQILGALHEAHQKGTVHRDVKPDNILVAQTDDGFETIKLLDFGIGRDLKRGRKTAEGVALGTPGYMAPEQILGDPVDARTDLYGAGCTLYRMLAGRPPVPPGHPDRPTEYFQMVIGQEPPSISQVRRDVPAAFAALLAKAVSRDPSARFPDCAQMRFALARMLPRLSDDVPPGYPRADDTDQDEVDTVQAFR